MEESIEVTQCWKGYFSFMAAKWVKMLNAKIISPLQTALGQFKTMNGGVHWSYSVLKELLLIYGCKMSQNAKIINDVDTKSLDKM